MVGGGWWVIIPIIIRPIIEYEEGRTTTRMGWEIGGKGKSSILDRIQQQHQVCKNSSSRMAKRSSGRTKPNMTENDDDQQAVDAEEDKEDGNNGNVDTEEEEEDDDDDEGKELQDCAARSTLYRIIKYY